MSKGSNFYSFEKISKRIYDSNLEEYEKKCLEETYEYINCKNSRSYFAKNYVFKNTLSRMQMSALEGNSTFGENLCVGSKRRSYRTSTMLTRAMHSYLFSENLNILYVAPNSVLSAYIACEFRKIYDELPGFLKPGLDIHRGDRMVSKSGNKIRFCGPQSVLEMRGQNFDLLLVDELSRRSSESSALATQTLMNTTENVLYSIDLLS